MNRLEVGPGTSKSHEMTRHSPWANLPQTTMATLDDTVADMINSGKESIISWRLHSCQNHKKTFG
jgi:hypothetical protein